MTNIAQVGNIHSSSLPYHHPFPRIGSRHHNKLWKDNNTKSGRAKTGILICLPHFFPAHSLFHNVASLPTTSWKPIHLGSQVSSILPDPVVTSVSSSLVSSEWHNTTDHFLLELTSFLGFRDITLSLIGSSFANWSPNVYKPQTPLLCLTLMDSCSLVALNTTDIQYAQTVSSAAMTSSLGSQADCSRNSSELVT